MPHVHPQRPMKAAHAMKDHNGRPLAACLRVFARTLFRKKRLGESTGGQAVEEVLRDIAVTLTEAYLAGAYYSHFYRHLPSIC